MRQTMPPAAVSAPLHVVTAAASPAKAATLKPARQGLPEAVPAVGSGMVPRAVAVPPPTTTTITVPRARAAGPPPPAPRTPAPSAPPALTSSYAAQKAAMESRHVQEFAKPPATESPQALAARQETEHRTLEMNYHQAAAAGKPVMPPPPPPPRPAPPPPPPPRPPTATAPHH